MPPPRPLACLSAVLLLWACTVNTTEVHGTMELGPNDNGRHVTLECGVRLRIRLPLQPGTGYDWELTRVPLFLAVRDHRWEGAGTDRPGAGEIHLFEFQTRRSGRGPLELAYRRANDPRSVTAETYRIDLEVIDADPRRCEP